MGLAILAGLGATVVLSVGLHLFTNSIPKLARIAVVKAARRLPALSKHNQEAAWLADFASLETHFEMLSCAAACWLTSFCVRLPFTAEKSHSALIRARTRLQAHGAIVSFALNRIKAWDTSTDASKWGLWEKWCIGVILISKTPMEERMKDYLVCLEQDLKEHPRQYENKEEAAKELFTPIYREMKIFQFLRDHDLGIDLSPTAETAGLR